MPTFKVIGTGALRHDGASYQPGDAIELSDEQAEDLIIDGVIQPFEGRVPKVKEAGDPPAGGDGKKPEEKELGGLTKAQLLEKAKELEIELTGDETKAQLVEKIEAAQAPAGDDL